METLQILTSLKEERLSESDFDQVWSNYSYFLTRSLHAYSKSEIDPSLILNLITLSLEIVQMYENPQRNKNIRFTSVHLVNAYNKVCDNILIKAAQQ